MLYKSFFLVSILLISASTYSLLKNPDVVPVSPEQIDALFSDWNGTDVPGGTIAVIEKGKVSYSKAYGMASLEYGVPNRTETIYNIASVSKQFTAYAMVLLEKQGKLSLDDDIKKYLPDVPDFGETITIRHTLTHTSGLRSLHALLGMAGWRGDDRRSNADLRRFIAQQRELNFPVGSEYLYCNTGFMFCADIVEEITGQSFEVWMQEHVFEPMGMHSTFCRRDINQVVPDVATSYYGPSEEQFSKAVEYWAYIGSGNMHSTVDDLAAWMNQFRNPSPEFLKLQENGILTNGDTISYALGINVTTYRGTKVIHHGGSIGGYRSFFVFFPEHDLGFILLSNRSSGDVGTKAFELADLHLADHLEPAASPVEREKELEQLPWNPTDKERIALLGQYYSPELDTYYDVRWAAAEGYHLYHQRHGIIPVEPRDQDELASGILRVRFEKDKRGKITGLRASNGRARHVWMEKR